MEFNLLPLEAMVFLRGHTFGFFLQSFLFTKQIPVETGIWSKEYIMFPVSGFTFFFFVKIFVLRNLYTVRHLPPKSSKNNTEIN